MAGLPGRRYVFAGVDDPTFCSIEIDLLVSITFGINGSENITLTANSPDVLDRLCEVATDGARVLRAKVNRQAGGNANH